jgi:hypothetical protein
MHRGALGAAHRGRTQRRRSRPCERTLVAATVPVSRSRSSPCGLFHVTSSRAMADAPAAGLLTRPDDTDTAGVTTDVGYPRHWSTTWQPQVAIRKRKWLSSAILRIVPAWVAPSGASVVARAVLGQPRKCCCIRRFLAKSIVMLATHVTRTGIKREEMALTFGSPRFAGRAGRGSGVAAPGAHTAL